MSFEWTDGQGDHVRYAIYDGAGELLSELESLNGGAITPVRDYVYASGRLVAIQDFSPYTSSCSAPAVTPARSLSGEGGMEPEGQPAGVETFWAMAWDHYVPSVAPVEYQPPASRTESSLTYEYPVLDVTGTPRMWVDNQGNVISRGFAGPYGEDLGFYHGQTFTALGFASLQDEHQDAGVFYTPNRFLSTTGRFLSADPSGSMNLHDPKTLNQYAYVAQNPLLLVDPWGEAAWDITNRWDQDYINQFRNFVSSRADSYRGRYTCEDFALSLVIDFASSNNLPVKITTGAGTFDAASDQFETKTDFEHAVLKHAGASDLQRGQNTVAESLNEVKPGDVLLNRNASGRAHHVQVVVSAQDSVIEIRQGNFNWLRGNFGIGSADPSNPLYSGTEIQEGIFYLNADHYYPAGAEQPKYQHAIEQLNLEARTWNFLEWNK